MAAKHIVVTVLFTIEKTSLGNWIFSFYSKRFKIRKERENSILVQDVVQIIFIKYQICVYIPQSLAVSVKKVIKSGFVYVKRCLQGNNKKSNVCYTLHVYINKHSHRTYYI